MNVLYRYTKEYRLENIKKIDDAFEKMQKDYKKRRNSNIRQVIAYIIIDMILLVCVNYFL